ncbi:MAG: hypothetical protein ACYDEA_01845 [Candidatus Dormibacteria bacterium]
MFEVVVVGYATSWEAVWLALRLAGGRPEGQLPSGFVRLGQAWSHGQHFAGGWVAMLWAPARSASLVLVVLILLVEGLVVVAVLQWWRARRRWSQAATSPSRGGWGGRRGPRSGVGGSGGNRQKPASSQLDTSLEEWLQDQASGGSD